MRTEVEELPPGFDRRELVALFRLADDSEAAIAGYLDAGRVFVARAADGEIVGHLQVTPGRASGELEVKSLAVAEALQGRGIGAALVREVLARLLAEGVRRVLVGTSSADLATLGFYQRLGFRCLAVERDAFTPAGGYPADLRAEGIPVRDRLWLDRDLP